MYFITTSQYFIFEYDTFYKTYREGLYISGHVNISIMRFQHSIELPITSLYKVFTDEKSYLMANENKFIIYLCLKIMCDSYTLFKSKEKLINLRRRVPRHERHGVSLHALVCKWVGPNPHFTSRLKHYVLKQNLNGIFLGF